MKKLNYLLVLVFVISFLVIGCVKSPVKPYEPPKGCLNPDGSQKTSLILNAVQYPKEVALVLKIANYEVVKKTKLTKGQVFEFFDTVDKLLSDGVTYFALYALLAEKIEFLNKLSGTEMLIISQYFSDIGTVKLPIYECDIILIRKHLSEQKMILSTLTE